VIFLSYSWKDSTFAHQLGNSLVANGHEVWIDYRKIHSDESLMEQIQAGIRESKLFLLVESSHASSSDWVRWECRLAAQHGIPFRVCKPSPVAASLNSNSDFGGVEKKNLFDVRFL
jgi:hypothetical protein